VATAFRSSVVWGEVPQADAKSASAAKNGRIGTVEPYQTGRSKNRAVNKGGHRRSKALVVPYDRP
jgi:hypothetical protein